VSSRPSPIDPTRARATLRVGDRSYAYYRLDAAGVPDIERLPYTVKVLLENMLRGAASSPELVTPQDLAALAAWDPSQPGEYELPFMPARVILQDFTGVPCVVDLAAMRDAVATLGGDPSRINPLVPADLVIDHSVQVDMFGSDAAFAMNVEREYERNGERYALLRWAQQAFADFRVVPPGTGIVHQVNLEYLADVVSARETDAGLTAFPDTLVGTDSHTTMINGLGVVGWGVGGIEAEAALLGQPLYQPMPIVVGFRLDGEMPSGATATDLVLYVTEMLRAHGVVGKFVEFHGPGLSRLGLADRATISNMSPEFGATATLFPIDDETLSYLRMTGRPSEVTDRVEAYAKAQGLFRTDASPDPVFNESLSLDLGTVLPSVAGPRRPQDRVALGDLRENFRGIFSEGLHSHADGTAHEHEAPPKPQGIVEEASDESFPASDPPSYTRDLKPVDSAQPPRPMHTNHVEGHYRAVEVEQDGQRFKLRSGSVVIAAITSCTNTSNPSVMVAAGLLARNAVAAGLETPAWVKTSLAPGSRAVTDYLEAAGLMAPLEALHFNLVGYGCTTCIGNSGPLAEPIAEAIEANDLVGVAVLSGNRNFEGRIHPLARASYLASPPLVVAFALAGRIDLDLTKDPLGTGSDGRPVFLADLWPTSTEVAEVIARCVRSEIFTRNYASVFDGDERWRGLPAPEGDRYAWEPDSTYVALPPFFEGLSAEPAPIGDIVDARALAMLGDSVTTDHISPAGSIPRSSPAGEWLTAHGVEMRDFNSYGSRRGHHEVMMRGTFANIRLHNLLTPDKEGNVTEHLPSGERMSIFDASARYRADGTPLVLLAGREYGSGSSRDWAAKGPYLLGVRAVIAESYERIHRSNLVGMGILPLQYLPGENASSLGLTGRETFAINGLGEGLRPRQELTVIARDEAGSEHRFQAIARLDGQVDVEYHRNGGVLQTVLRRLARAGSA